MEISATVEDFRTTGMIFPIQLAYLANEEDRWILDNDSGLV